MYNIINGEDVTSQSISKLFQLVWGGDFDEINSKTNWAFYKTRSKVLLYQHDGQLIATRGGIYWPLSIENRKLNCIQFHGTCVHPDFRRRGIFTSINKDFLKEVEKEGLDIIFNVSVDASRAGYEKLGWNYLKGFRRLTRVVKPISILRNKLSIKTSHSLAIDNENEEIIFPIKFLEERNKVLSNMVHCPYTNEFLRWRLSNPKANYKALETENGILFYKVNKSKSNIEIVIGDCFLKEYKYSYFSEIIDKLIDKENPCMIFTYIFNGHPCYIMYLRKFFMPNPLRYNLNFGIRPLNNKIDINNKKWAMSYLDIDTF